MAPLLPSPVGRSGSILGPHVFSRAHAGLLLSRRAAVVLIGTPVAPHHRAGGRQQLVEGRGRPRGMLLLLWLRLGLSREPLEASRSSSQRRLAVARRGVAAHHHVPRLPTSRGAHHPVAPAAVARSVGGILAVLAVVVPCFVGVLHAVMCRGVRYPHPAALLLLPAMLLVAGPRSVIVVIELGVVTRWPQVRVLVPGGHHPLGGLTGELPFTFPCHVLLLWLLLAPQQVLFAAVVLVIRAPVPAGNLAVVIGAVVSLDLPLLMWRKLAELRRRLLRWLRLRGISAPRTFQLVVRDQTRLHRGRARISRRRGGREVIPSLVVSVRSAVTRGS